MIKAEKANLNVFRCWNLQGERICSKSCVKYWPHSNRARNQSVPPPPWFRITLALQKISGRVDWKKIKIREMAAYPAREIILSCAPLISGEFIQLLSGHLVWLEHYFSLKNYANSVMLFGATKPYLIRLNAWSGVMTIYY